MRPYQYQLIYEKVFRDIAKKTLAEILEIQNKLDSHLEAIDGIGFYFKLEENGFRVFTYIYQNQRFIPQKDFLELKNQIGLAPKWQFLATFLEQKKIQSIVLKKECDIQILRDYLLGQDVELKNIDINSIVHRNYEQGEKVFSSFMALFPSISITNIDKFIRSYKQAGKSKNESLNFTCKRLTAALENLFTQYTKITFLIYYAPIQKRQSIPEPKGIHIFFDEEKMDIENSTLVPTFFYENFKNWPFLNTGERLNSLVLKKGITGVQLLYIAAKIRGKEAILASEIPDVAINTIRFDVNEELKFLQNRLQSILEEKLKLEERLIEKTDKDLEQKLEQALEEKKELEQQNKELEQELEQQKQKDTPKAEVAEVDISLRNVSSEKVTLELLQEIAEKSGIPVEEIPKLLSQRQIKDHIKDFEQSEIIDVIVEQAEVYSSIIEETAKSNPQSLEKLKQPVDNLSPFSQQKAEENWAEHLANQVVFPDIETYDFKKLYDPSHKPGGSALFIFSLDWKVWAIGLFDIEETGLEASFFMVEIKMLFERFLCEEPNKIIFHLQKEVAQIRHRRKFPCFSATVGIFNCIENTFTYTRAAMPYIYRFNREETVGGFIKHGGVPRIGLILPDQCYKEHHPLTININPGDIILLQTDGFMKSYQKVEDFEQNVKSILKELPMKYLFDLDLEHKKDLSKNYLSAKLQKEFENANIAFSSETNILFLNGQWYIHDEIQRKEYTVVEVQEKLSVYLWNSAAYFLGARGKQSSESLLPEDEIYILSMERYI